MKGACSCIDDINGLLKDRNTELGLAFSINRQTGAVTETVGIETIVSVKKRGAKPVRMLASYCPFCGAKYPGGDE